MQEALTEQYNDQLRELREAGLSETSKEFREIVRELRDEERAPLNATQVCLGSQQKVSRTVCALSMCNT